MTLIPIPGSNDFYDDGQVPTAVPPPPFQKTPVNTNQEEEEQPAQSEEESVPPVPAMEDAPSSVEPSTEEELLLLSVEETEVSSTATVSEEEPDASYRWQVPPLLKGTIDVFLGTTIHHDEGDPHGPRVTVFVGEVRDGTYETKISDVKSYYAADLSEQTFLDNMQKALAAAMQAHMLDWAERQRVQLVEARKRQTRQDKKPSTVPSQVPTKKEEESGGASAPTPVITPSKAVTQKENPESRQYTTVSLFD